MIAAPTPASSAGVESITRTIARTIVIRTIVIRTIVIIVSFSRRSVRCE